MGHGVEHSAGDDLDSLGAQAAGLLAHLVVGQVPVGSHHAPPREVGAVVRQETADRSRCAALTGPPGHLSVRHDLARLEAGHDGSELLLDQGHPSMVPRPAVLAARARCLPAR